MSKKGKKKSAMELAMSGPVAPIKKIMPEPIYIPGEFSYLCETCYIDWMQKKMEPTINCPSCGKLLHRDETFDKLRQPKEQPQIRVDGPDAAVTAA